MTSPARRLALGAFAMFGLSVLQRGLGLVSVTVLARVLEPRGLGAYNFTLSSSQTFQGLTRLGLDAGLHVELAASSPETDKHRIEQAMGEALAVTLAVSLLAAGAMIGLADIIADRLFAAPDLASFMKVGAVVMFGQCLAQICYVGFAGLNAFPSFSRTAMIGAAISVVSVVAGAVTAGAYGGALGLAAAQLATTALLFARLKGECARRNLALGLRVPTRQVLRLLKVGFPFYLGVLWMIPVEFYVLGLLSRSAGVEVLGQLRVVQALMAVVTVLPAALSGPLITYLTERHAVGQGAGALQLQLRLMWVSALILAILVASIFPLAIGLIFGPHFAHAGTVGALAVAPFIATMLLNVLQGGLLAQRRSMALFWIGAIMAGCHVGLAWLLVPDHGLMGFFVSQGAAYGLGAAATGLWLFGWSKLMRELAWKLVLLGATALTLALLALDASAVFEWKTRLAVSLGALVLVVASCWLGVFPADERRRLKGLGREAALGILRRRQRR
jgi:O-antigen/teichoic acid export membrane protein